MASILPCPECGAYQFFQSRKRNVLEKFRSTLLSQSPYRCHNCGHRTWIHIPFKFPELSKRKLLLMTLIILLSLLISQILTSSV